ncbi:DUF3821 domain-containing protein [Methanoregula sp.]|uniref:DUF3821 domain-containing protein n=1 Tax=Methanoregula sp. TaxID=2052170 RepID=UPI002C177DF2|nr:DUF3821 domain-containing protein [Methanoregula sp.]HVP96673.1 DUF3821 domain-containing protein [Methanoregula sp.]
MRTELKIRLGIVLIALCFLAVPVLASGGYTTIKQGGTVYIGEQGLDVTAAMGPDSSVGWWASGAAFATTSPGSQVQVTTPSNFYISSSAFGQYTGNWYRLDASGKQDGIAFVVADPQLAIRVIDTTINLDVTNKWIPRGDQAAFQLDTNLNPLFARGVSTTEGITIYVQSPAGGTYSALLDSAGTAHSLLNLAITSPSYQTPWSWDTGNSQYVTGTYTIWAKCEVNNMYNNYGVAGKTVSQQTSLLDQEQNPLISVNVPTTIIITKGITGQATPSSVPITQITSVPATQIPTTTGTPAPINTTMTLPTPTVTNQPVTVETTTPKVAGFGAIIAVISISCLIGFSALNREHKSSSP